MKNILTLFLFFVSCNLFAQRKMFDFEIDGRVNIDTGIVEMQMIYGKELYPSKFENIKSRINKGSFFIKGKIDNPIWVKFRIGEKYLSTKTVITSETQSVFLNIDSNYEEPKNTNSIAKEKIRFDTYLSDALRQTNSYRSHSSRIRKRYGAKLPDSLALKLQNELIASYVKHDLSLLNFVNENPDSYYALNKLYNLLDFGYNSTLDSIYNRFSDSLKNSRQGQSLFKKIQTSKIISKGQLIPSFNVQNIKGIRSNINQYSKKRYTLIDLWYTTVHRVSLNLVR